MRYDSLAVIFKAPFEVQSETIVVPPPDDNQLLVESHASAISGGTEMLVYRGQLPQDMTLDESIEGMKAKAVYPLQYGYSAVGHVREVGSQVDKKWIGEKVFAFSPHAGHFLSTQEALVRLPHEVSLEDGVLLANMETAVSFLMDGRPMIGERVLVVGLGIVGLLTAALLAQQSNVEVHCVDLLESRRRLADALDVKTETPESLAQHAESFDLVYELSGHPAGLNQAIQSTRQHGRIIVGSWYGSKPSQIDLGGRFHRSKVMIYPSQVSSIAPELAGRWTKQRRMNVAIAQLNRIKPSKFVSHRFHVKDAAKAYRLIDTQNEDVLQVILEYGQV